MKQFKQSIGLNVDNDPQLPSRQTEEPQPKAKGSQMDIELQEMVNSGVTNEEASIMIEKDDFIWQSN
mgnify:FL=1